MSCPNCEAPIESCGSCGATFSAWETAPDLPAAVEITDEEQLSRFRLGTVFTDRDGDVWMLDSHGYPSRPEKILVSPETQPMVAFTVLRKYGPLRLAWGRAQ